MIQLSLIIKFINNSSENTKEITPIAGALNRQEIYINFNLDFLAFEEIYFENDFANQLRRSFVL